MNKSTTLSDKLRFFAQSKGWSRDAREFLYTELKSKSTRRFRLVPLFDSARLDLALFFHRYFSAVIFASLLLVGTGTWIALSGLLPATPNSARHIVPSQAIAKLVPTRQYSIPAMSSSRVHSPNARMILIEEPTMAKSHIAEITAPSSEKLSISILSVNRVQPIIPVCAMPSGVSTPVAIHPERLRFVEPPLDYSGMTFSVQFEQSNISADPAHSEFASKSLNDLNYAVGYRFDRFEEAGLGYSRHTYRQISSNARTYLVYDPSTGQTHTIHQTVWSNSDNLISLPGIYYTFHANNLNLFGIEPFATAFASKPSEGFLWRASAGLEWNAWDNLNAVFTYSREQLNSGAYATPQNAHNLFNFGLTYLWQP